MASATLSLHISMAIGAPSTSYAINHHLRLLPATAATTLKLQQFSSSRCSVVTYARRRSLGSRSSVPSSKKKKKKLSSYEEDLDGDPLEALFQMLEQDLKNDVTYEYGDYVSAKDLGKLDQELGEALSDDELLEADDTLDETRNEATEVKIQQSNQDQETEEEEEDDEEVKEPALVLRRWQLRRLAYALKEGRRKIRIKALAADVLLDRSVVLDLLRDPPPDLLRLSASLPDKPEPRVLEPIIKPEDAALLKVEKVEKVAKDAPKVKATEEAPVHELHRSWSVQKRLKKVQIDTLEMVYRRSKRPTNAMISNIVHLTNIPRKKIVKWFEDKRTEEGLPDSRPRRAPYRRSDSESVFTS